MKYLNTYRLFESNEDVNINQVIFDLKHLNNNSHPGFDIFSEMDNIAFDAYGNYKGLKFDLDDFYDKISYDGLIKDEIDISSLKSDEKDVLIELHRMALEKYDLSSIPSFDDIIDSLQTLYDIAHENGIENKMDVVAITFNFKEKHSRIDINPFQKMKISSIPEMHHKYSFDINLYQQINDEITSLYARLSGMYDVTHYAEMYHNNVEISLVVKNK